MSSKSDLMKKREALRSKISKKKQDMEELTKQILMFFSSK